VAQEAITNLMIVDNLLLLLLSLRAYCFSSQEFAVFAWNATNSQYVYNIREQPCPTIKIFLFLSKDLTQLRWRMGLLFFLVCYAT